MESVTPFQQLTEPFLLSFYGWWQFLVCLFAFVALVAIWWHIGRKQKDFGQIWLALSVLCWSFSGIVEIDYANEFRQQSAEIYQLTNQLLQAQGPLPDAKQISALKTSHQTFLQQQEARSFQFNGWRSILSLFNSLFILLALPWFRYIPKRIEAVVKSRYWHFIVGLPFLFSLLPTLSKLFMGKTLGSINELDVYYALLTLVFLGLILWESFYKRRLTGLAWLSVVCILITLVAQIYKLIGSNVDLPLYSAVFKTSLIMIFFALALSWVKELAENVIPNAQQLFLHLSRKKNEQDKFEHLLQLRGMPGKEERKILLTPALYELCHKFVERKLEGEGWMEIKPKSDSRSGKSYDIRDHNEVKRLLVALLDGIFGKGSWTLNLHLSPIKETLFEMSEKRERKIRLRIPAENLSIEG